MLYTELLYYIKISELKHTRPTQYLLVLCERNRKKLLAHKNVLTEDVKEAFEHGPVVIVAHDNLQLIFTLLMFIYI